MRQQLRYLACILSSAGIVALLGAAAAYSGHHGGDLPRLLAAVLVVMVGIGIPGAWLIFRPVGVYLASQSGEPPLRLRRLPRLTAAWVYTLTALTIGWHAGATHGSWREVAAAGGGVLAAMAAHVVVFAAYIALYTYFIVSELVVALRLELWHTRSTPVAAGHGRLATRVTIGLTAVAAAPLLLAFADPRSPVEAARFPEAIARHHAIVREALQMDVIAAALLTVMLIGLIVRGVARPVRILLEAMHKVDRGDLSTRAPVVSDDELGALTERFNLMVSAISERERMRRTFSRFVPDEVAGALLADDGAIVPQEREASVLYADIERFTSIAAALAPADILGMLNAYFRELARIIHAHHGVITQFQGDAVLAGFNLPAPLPHHARHAVEAALKIRAHLGSLALANGAHLHMRVGVTTGRVIGGTVGGDEHLGYTLHGDTVNRAARLEELNKELGTRVLIDGRTAELLGNDFRLRDHGAPALRGFASPVRVYEPLVSPVDAAHA